MLLLLLQQKEFSQKKFMLNINGKIREDVYMQAEYRKKIIMDGRCCKGSSYWLTSAPNRDFLTIIEPASFRVLLKYSMGIQL
jgi:hypothetical protein